MYRAELRPERGGEKAAGSSGARPPRAEYLVPLLSLLGAGTMLGLSTDLAKLAPKAGLPPLAFLAWSLVGATLVLAVAGAVRGRPPSFNARTAEYFLVAGLVGLAAPTLIFFSAVPHVGASFVAVSVALPPLYTYAGTLLLRMERFDPWRASGVALTLGGSILLAALKLSQPDAPVFWIVMTLSAPISLAAGNIYRTLRWPAGSSADQLAPGVLGAAALMLFVFGALPGFGAFPDLSLAVPAGDAAAMALIVAQATAFAVQYLLFFVVQQRGGPVYVSLLGSVAAVVGSAVAILLLGEAAPRGFLVGGVLIAIGVGLVVRGGARRS